MSGNERYSLSLVMLAVFVVALGSSPSARAAEKGGAAAKPSAGGQTIPGDRTLLGTVKQITGGQIEVDTGEVQPRSLPLKDAQEKGFPKVKVGDKLNIVVNEQNMIVDFHPADQTASHTRVTGQIAHPLPVGHETVIIRKDDGSEESFAIKAPARSKVASLPVGKQAVFLIDETHQIADVVAETGGAAGRKSPIKGAQQRIEGKIVELLHANQIRIRTQDGKEHPYDVRPMVQDKLAELKKGQDVILLLADDNTVIDVAIPQGRKGKGRG